MLASKSPGGGVPHGHVLQGRGFLQGTAGWLTGSFRVGARRAGTGEREVEGDSEEEIDCERAVWGRGGLRSGSTT